MNERHISLLCFGNPVQHVVHALIHSRSNKAPTLAYPDDLGYFKGHIVTEAKLFAVSRYEEGGHTGMTRRDSQEALLMEIVDCL